MKGSDFFIRLMFSILLIGVVVTGVPIALANGVITYGTLYLGIVFGVVAGVCLLLSLLCAIWE
jgi:hypothetical protein